MSHPPVYPLGELFKKIRTPWDKGDVHPLLPMETVTLKVWPLHRLIVTQDPDSVA